MINKENCIALIDYILSQSKKDQPHLQFNPEKFTHNTESGINDFSAILDALKENKGFLKYGMDGRSDEDDNYFIDSVELNDINTLALFEYRRKLSGETQGPIVKLMALEQMARIIGNHDSASGLIKLLHDVGLSDCLSEYKVADD